MLPDDRGETGPELFQEIADFWSAQLNNEIFTQVNLSPVEQSCWVASGRLPCKMIGLSKP
jgi:hypothetical protein